MTEEPVSQAMNAEKRAVSRIPAIPTTRSFGKPETAWATWHIASSGLETTTITLRGDRRTTSFVTEATIASFVVTRSSRLIPGDRGRPAVITTTSEPFVTSYLSLPTIVGSYPVTDAIWFMSSALPDAKFGTMSTSTTSA